MRGSLEERRPGVWRVRLYRGKNARPPYHSHTFEAKGKRAAAKIAGDTITQWDKDDAAAKDRAETINGLLDDWLEQQSADNPSPNTVYRQASIVKRIRDDLGHKRVVDVTTKDVDTWVAGLRKKRKGKKDLSDATRAHYLRVLRAVLKQAWRWDMIDVDPAARARPVKVEQTDMSESMPTVEAWRVLIGQASRNVRTALMLATATGCRRSELVGLRWSDIEGDELKVQRSLAKVPGQQLVVKSTKAHKVRRMTLPPFVFPELEAHRAWQEEQAAKLGGELADGGPILAHLLVDPTGRTPYKPDWLSQGWERLLKKVGMKGLHLHGLRHLHASELAKLGISIAAISERQGHSAVSTTTDYYLHGDVATDRAAAAALDSVFGVLPSAEPKRRKRAPTTSPTVR